MALPVSVDHVNPYDILAMNGASAALMLSHIPFPTPVGAVRIGKVEGNFVVNPEEEDLAENTELDLIVAGTDEAILMVEAGAAEIPEAEILDALDIAHSEIKKICQAQRDLAAQAGKEKIEVDIPQVHEDLYEEIKRSHGAALDAATQVEDKLDRQTATKAVEEAVLEQYSGDPEAETFAEYRIQRPAGVRQAGEGDHPRADRGAEAPPGWPQLRGDPPDLDRGRPLTPGPRFGAVHPRPDAGAERRCARHDA